MTGYHDAQYRLKVAHGFIEEWEVRCSGVAQGKWLNLNRKEP
jgi:hypothetical protein